MNNSGVQSINNVYAIVNKVENVCVYQYIFDLIDDGVYVVYALYSRIFDYKKCKKKPELHFFLGFEPMLSKTWTFAWLKKLCMWISYTIF